MGFSMTCDISEYYRSHEKALARDPKFLSKTFLETENSGIKKSKIDELIDNPLLSFSLLHHALSCVDYFIKNESLDKCKPMILTLLGFISINCYDSKKNIFLTLKRM